MDDGFERYRPQHELPIDVKTLPRDETVCKYCGISYLIHNEIKKLEEKVDDLQRELERYQGYATREAEVTKKLKDVLEERDKAKVEEERERMGHLRASRELKQQQLQVEKLLANRQSSQKQITVLEEEIIKWRDKFLSSTHQLPCILEKVQLCQGVIHSARQLFCEHSKAISNCIVHTKEEMGIAVNQLNGRIKRLVSAKHEVMTAFAKSEDKLRETNVKLHEADASVANLENLKKELLDQVLTSEKCCEGLIVSKQSLEVEMENHKTTLKSLRQEIVSLQAQLKQTEETAIHDKESCVGDVKKLEKTVEMLKKECCSLQEEIRQYELKEAAWKDKNMRMEGELVSVKSCMVDLQRELDMAKREKEKLTEAHHVLLEQLRESYHKKLYDAKALHQQHEDKLEVEAMKSKEECLQLRNELQQAKTELRNLQGISESAEVIKGRNDQLKDQLMILKSDNAQVIQRLQGEILKEKATSEAALNSHISETRLLRSQLVQLQNQLEVALLENDKMAKKLMSLEKVTAEEEPSRAGDTQAMLQKASDEIQFLRNTVQRECEERIKLTEALETARLQLHEVRHGNLISPFSSSVASAATAGNRAVSATGSTSRSSRGRLSSGQLEVNRRRIEAAMGRSSRTGKY